MSFNSRDEFIEAQASEKITLAQIEASKRLVVWTGSGPVYEHVTNAYVVNLKVSDTPLTKASSASVAPGQWYYDPVTSTVYVQLSDSSDPNVSEIIATGRFFFGDAPIAAPFDLPLNGPHTDYDGRIQTAPGFKHRIGTDQKLISVTSQGTLRLENNDGGLDPIYDTWIFENKEVRIYSWNRDLPFSDARIIYRGRVTNKTYSSSSVSFTVKDNLFDLQQSVPQDPYSDADNVTDSIKGRYKRWLYGKVDGLKLQSIDQIGDGYEIAGTVSASVTGPTLTGSGTSFLTDVSPDDRLTIGTQEFTVESIQNDTELTLDDTPEFSFTNQPAVLRPEIPTTVKNREFLVAGHACARLTKQVVNLVQLNRIVLSDVEGILPGDFLTFNTGERIEVRNTAPGNIVVLRQNYILQPLVGSNVNREPVQEIFIEGTRVGPDQFTITNSAAETRVTLTDTAEFDIARTVSLGDTLTFSTGSRTVAGTGNVDLRELVSPRDFIRPQDITFTTFYEVLSVDEAEITLRETFTEPNETGPASIRRPNYIGDDTVVSANTLGRTVDGTPGGKWIITAAEACLDLLNEIDVPSINQSTFAQGALDNSELVSLAIPASPSGSLETTKTVIDKLCRSTNSAVTLDSDLQLKFEVLQPEIDPQAREVNDVDVINWSIKSTSGDNIRNSIIRYRHQDILRDTLEDGTLVQTHTSDFVKNYVGTNKTDELDVYLYNVRSARVMAHRLAYLRSLSRADVKLTTDLRLEAVEIGDQLILNFERLYSRLGDQDSRKKVCVVVGKTVTGSRIEFELTDLGNIFNRSSIITSNFSPDYSAANEDDKLKLGYITDAQGIVETDESSANVHLIS